MKWTLMSAAIAALAAGAAFADALPSFPMFTRPTNMGDKAFSVRAGYRGGCQTPVQALQVMIAAEDGRKC